jgi:neopullulanase
MLEPEPPDWVADAVFYQIFPDRFAQSSRVPKPSNLEPWGASPTYHGYQGGDLLGVVERLDYLQEIGVNALYFTPIFRAACNHRYHTHDYHVVDPMLGGNQALRTLIDESHARGMRIVLDGVFNHASRGFFPFHDILENGPHSAYIDWFTVHGFPLHAYDGQKKPNYDAWWGLPALPKFNIKNPHVREFLLDVATRWVEFGIDGWRLDVPNEIEDDGFWREFRRRVRAINPEVYIVGEIWQDGSRWLKGDMWDAVMNYALLRALIGFCLGEHYDQAMLKKTSLHPPGEPGAESFALALEQLLARHHPRTNFAMLNLIGSHDMARFLSLARNDRSALRLAIHFLMTFPGAPCVYYGDEIGMLGGHDPDNRRAFPWHRPDSWDHDIKSHVQRLIRLRKHHVSLRRGEFQILWARHDVLVYLRRDPQETTITLLNAAREPRHVQPVLPEAPPAGALLQDALHPATVRAIEGHTLPQFDLGPRSSETWIIRRS